MILPGADDELHNRPGSHCGFRRVRVPIPSAMILKKHHFNDILLPELRGEVAALNLAGGVLR